MTNLTQEQMDKARELRAQIPPMGWLAIMGKVGAGVYAIRSAIEPGYRDYRTAQARISDARREGRKTKKINLQRPASVKEVCFSWEHDKPFDIPEQVLLERDHRASLVPKSLTARMLGDPLPGRSALDRIQQGEKA